jgi:ribosome biogenesis protein MAK21
MTGTVEKKRRRRGNKNKDSNVESTEKHQSHNLTLIKLDEGSPTWHEYGKDLPGRNDTIFTKPPQPSHQSVNNLFIQYRAMGDVLYQKEIQLVGKNSVRGSDKRWVENTMKKGTLKDRIAATSVTVSNDPVHKFYALDGLLSMAGCSETGGKTNSRVAQLSAEALQDLFINTLLPTNRKLLSLSQRPLYLYETSRGGRGSKKSLSPRILLLWRFEEMVKSKYELFLRKYLSNTLKEGAEMHKIATLQLAAALLVSTPEGESQLLAMVVNKLGDPGKKTAAAAGHQLRMILQKHPNMQVVIAREVQQLAHRPHLSSKALYNCIVFLNQLKLEKEGETKTQKGTETLPASLIKTYFRLFEVAVKNAKKESRGTEGKGMKSRLLSALL